MTFVIQYIQYFKKYNNRNRFKTQRNEKKDVCTALGLFAYCISNFFLTS